MSLLKHLKSLLIIGATTVTSGPHSDQQVGTIHPEPPPTLNCISVFEIFTCMQMSAPDLFALTVSRKVKSSDHGVSVPEPLEGSKRFA